MIKAYQSFLAVFDRTQRSTKKDRARPAYFAELAERLVSLVHNKGNLEEVFCMSVASGIELEWRDGGCQSVVVDAELARVLENSTVDGPMAEYAMAGLAAIGANVFSVSTPDWEAVVCAPDAVDKVGARAKELVGSKVPDFPVTISPCGPEVLILNHERGDFAPSLRKFGLDRYDRDREYTRHELGAESHAEFILRLLLYVSLYPEALRDALPARDIGEVSPYFRPTRVRGVHPRVDHTSPEAHFRRYHFRRYPIRQDGTRREGLVFVHGSMVQGRARFVDGRGLNAADRAA